LGTHSRIALPQTEFLKHVHSYGKKVHFSEACFVDEAAESQGGSAAGSGC